MSANNIIRHVRNYASAGLVSALVGLITFPIMTRSLSVDDYGIMGLITASAALAAAFGKLGLQHAIVRFYAESLYEKRGRTLLEFNTTIFSVFSILSVIAVILWLIAGTFVVPRFMQNENITEYFWVVAIVIALRMVGSATWNMLRARQDSGAVSKTTVLGRLSYLAMLLLLYGTGYINLYTLLTIFVLAELIGVVYATHIYRPHFSFDLSAYSPTLVKSLLMFGLPLMVMESLTLILRLTDRYMIGSFLGDRSLGLYSASYNLSSYIELIITGSIAAALRPMFTDIWEHLGEEETCKFLNRSLHIYLMLGIPFMFAFVLVAPHLLSILASDRYLSGTSIIPFIAATIFFDGALIFLSAGLYFRGSTNTLMLWGIAAGIFNIVGNYIIIPRFGIVGAAIVTMTSYMIFTTGVSTSSMKLLNFGISWKKPLLMAFVSVIVYQLVSRMELGSNVLDFFGKGTLATATLLALLLTIDQTVREWTLMMLKTYYLKLRRRTSETEGQA